MSSTDQTSSKPALWWHHNVGRFVVFLNSSNVWKIVSFDPISKELVLSNQRDERINRNKEDWSHYQVSEVFDVIE